jgi:hypothetical protein
MSNLGPSLAWYTERPVIHLALTPGDVDACRQRLEVHHLVLAFRDASRAWPGWDEMVARPADAPHHPEWNVLRVRRWTVKEGFSLIWLELGPPRLPLARSLAAPPARTPRAAPGTARCATGTRTPPGTTRPGAASPVAWAVESPRR